MRLGVSAVQHAMKRGETVEEVEKNTELERQTPKGEAGGSIPFWRAKIPVKSKQLLIGIFLQGRYLSAYCMHICLHSSCSEVLLNPH